MFKLYSKQLTKNKFIEFELRTEKDVFPKDWFDFTIRWTTEEDNAGVVVKLTLLQLIKTSIRFHDSRYWNEMTNHWHTERSWEEYKNKLNS